MRSYATGDLWIYVNPATGSDMNPGTDPATPMLTRQGALDRLMRDWDLAGYKANIQLQDGIYRDTMRLFGHPVGDFMVRVWGNPANSSAVIIAPPVGYGFNVQDNAIMSVRDVRVEGASVIGFWARQHVILDLTNIVLGDLSVGIGSVYQTVVNLTGRVTIDGSMAAFIQCMNMSQIAIAGDVEMTITKPVVISYFVQSYQNSFSEFLPSLPGKTMFINPGNVTGQQYLADYGGTVMHNGHALPGTIPGVANAVRGGMAY